MQPFGDNKIGRGLGDLHIDPTAVHLKPAARRTSGTPTAALQQEEATNCNQASSTSSSPINSDALLNRKLDNPKTALASEESIALLTDCIKRGELEAQKAAGKDLIVFIGNTGAGKSTFVNYLYGCEMVGKSPKELGIVGLGGKVVVVKPDGPIKEIMPIGHTKKSTTFMPKIETDSRGYTYCDCPGFLDNRGFEINIANAVNIKNAFIRARSVKVIMLINYHSLAADKGRGLKDMIEISCDLFGSKENLVRNKDSILLGITQVPALPADEEGEELEMLKAWIKDTDLTDQFEKSTLQYLSECLFIYDPLNRKNLKYNDSWSRDTLLRTLRELTAIREPKAIFKTVLTAEDEKGLRYICDEIKAKIQALFSKTNLVEEDFKAIAGYQESLKKLEIIENPHVLKLIGETRHVITEHFRKMISRFDICCADTNSKMAFESERILSDLRKGVKHFDQQIRSSINIAELEKRYAIFIKKQEAKKATLELHDFERNFRNACLSTNFKEALNLLKIIKEKVQVFDREYGQTGEVHRLNVEELSRLYGASKKRVEEEVAEKGRQKKQIDDFEKQRKEQEKIIEQQKLREQELIEERRKEKAEAERLKKEEAAWRKKEQELEERREIERIRRVDDRHKPPISSPPHTFSPQGFGNTPAINMNNPAALKMQLFGPMVTTQPVPVGLPIIVTSKGNFRVLDITPLGPVVNHSGKLYVVNDFGAQQVIKNQFGLYVPC